MSEDELQLRIYGDDSRQTLIYLPGLHGDWTLIGPFRRAIGNKVRFVEVVYPRTLTWSLDDYAEAIENALTTSGITQGWLLGESYGSQVLWPLAGRGNFKAQGLILAGGFVKHPMRRTVLWTEKLTARISTSFFVCLIFGTAKIARYRCRRSPEKIAFINEFILRRTPLDRQAAQHRLRLIARNDPCAIARTTTTPVFALTGSFDPIVPWRPVRRWLQRNCPALRDFKVFTNSDHNVLRTSATSAASQILEWMMENRDLQKPATG